MKTGLIGLGNMGTAMASNLYKAGFLHAIWNRNENKTHAFCKEHKVPVLDSLATLARQCELIITCVSADKDLLEVINKIKPDLNANTIIIDTSTVSVQTAKDLCDELSEIDVAFIDAPVSGGVEGAKNAQLVMMAGGNEEILNHIRPVLESITKRVEYMGSCGNGQATKAVNQVMAAGINQAVSEALALADAAGLDLEKVIDVISGGAAGNWFLQHRGQTMTNNIFDPGFKMNLHHKDLLLCKQLVQQLNDGEKSLPIIEMTLIHYQRLMDAGFGEEDISSLYRLKKEVFD